MESIHSQAKENSKTAPQRHHLRVVKAQVLFAIQFLKIMRLEGLLGLFITLKLKFTPQLKISGQDSVTSQTGSCTRKRENFTVAVFIGQDLQIRENQLVLRRKAQLFNDKQTYTLLQKDHSVCIILMTKVKGLSCPKVILLIEHSPLY